MPQEHRPSQYRKIGCMFRRRRHRENKRKDGQTGGRAVRDVLIIRRGLSASLFFVQAPPHASEHLHALACGVYDMLAALQTFEEGWTDAVHQESPI